MIDEAYVKLKTDDALWPAIAAKIGFTDPAVVVAYRNLARSEDNPPYNRGLIAPTQTLRRRDHRDRRFDRRRASRGRSRGVPLPQRAPVTSDASRAARRS